MLVGQQAQQRRRGRDGAQPRAPRARPRRARAPPRTRARSDRASARGRRAARGRWDGRCVASPAASSEVRERRGGEHPCSASGGAPSTSSTPRRPPAPPARAGGPAAAGSATGRALAPARTGRPCRRRSRTASGAPMAASARFGAPSRCSGEHRAVAREEHRAAHQPRPPLRTGEEVVEALGVLEVPHEDRAGHRQRRQRDQRRLPAPQRIAPGQRAGERERQRHEVRARGDPLRPRVQAHAPIPRRAVRDVVGEHGRRRAVVRRRRAGRAASPCSDHMNRPPSGRRAASGSSVAWCAPR